MDLVFGDFVFVEAVGDVVFDIEGVEQGAFLEDHADVGAHGEDFALGHGGKLATEDGDLAGVGVEETVGELHEGAFATAGGAEDDAGFAAGDGEGNVGEDFVGFEADGDMVEGDDGCAFGEVVDEAGGNGEGGGHGYRPKMPIMNWVTRKSQRMMRTEETTTAWVVARPTPRVPPVVVSP